jgi:branched-chain amino acid transport system ATP-binding protein
MLSVRGLHTYYGAIHALHGVSIDVPDGKIVTLIGSNGAGKSTTVLSIAGILRVGAGSSVELNGENITNMQPNKIVKRGVNLSPEGREVFPSLTVGENLRLGAYVIRHDKKRVRQGYDRVYSLFPRLRERERQTAGTLSGGEQQMLAIGRALMSGPSLLMLDEPSLGLAPNLVRIIFRLIAEINGQGVTVLLIEQNANMALKIADYAYVMETGRVVLEGPAKELSDDENVRRAYLGLNKAT